MGQSQRGEGSLTLGGGVFRRDRYSGGGKGWVRGYGTRSVEQAASVVQARACHLRVLGSCTKARGLI